MAKLKVQNVGPIKSGYDNNNGFIDFKAVTLFIGNQGSGKSTIAKLFSTLSWIEKALVRGDFTERHVMQYNRFKKHLAYQNLANYISTNSYIEYVGEAYCMKFENGQFTVDATQSEINTNYSFPKIMYVPAERNFVSSVDRPDLVKRLPLPLYTFMDEYEAAKQRLTAEIQLPVGNISFEYRKQNKKSFLTGSDYSVELLEASSGFQSLVPLVLVTRHLTGKINTTESDSRKEINREEEEKIRKTVAKLIANKNISDDVMRVLLEKLSSKYRYECFINVVEEPEQNLFPNTQKSILFELLKYRNSNPHNKLVITTHSPYLINYLTLAVKAESLKQSITAEEQLTKLNSIVPPGSTLKHDDLLIYEMHDNNGSIKKLEPYQDLPSDENQLNEKLGEGNELFAQLLEIEQSI